MGANALGQKKLKKFSNKLNITFVKGCEWGHENGIRYYRLFDEKPQDVVVDDLILEKEPVIKPKKSKKIDK